MIQDDIYYMAEALKEANKALKKDEVPIGCVIVNKEGTIIARAHNIKERQKDPSAHAEILAIKKACKKLKDWRLNDCTIYVTVEPCLMCGSCILQSRISKLVFGISEDNTGAFGSKHDLVAFSQPKITVVKGILSEDSKQLLQGFFEKKRKKQLK